MEHKNSFFTWFEKKLFKIFTALVGEYVQKCPIKSKQPHTMITS